MDVCLMISTKRGGAWADKVRVIIIDGIARSQRKASSGLTFDG